MIGRKLIEPTTALPMIPAGMKTSSTVRSGQQQVPAKIQIGYLRQLAQRNVVMINGLLAASKTNSIAIPHLGQVGAIKLATRALLRTTGTIASTSLLHLVVTKTLSIGQVE